VHREVDVPLSDNEQRLLEQMERALSAEDPKFASAMRGAARRSGAGRRLVLGIAAVLAGLVLLIVSVNRMSVPIGVGGFLCMLAGTAYALSARRRGGPAGVVSASGSVRPAAAAKRRKPTFMQRMEQRWDRRRDER
jgi:Protein of unknown function (DUF3040)